MIKKTSTFLTGIRNLPFIPKVKHHGSILILAGLILILTGLILNTRYFLQKEMQYRSSLQRVVLFNSFYQYNPANVVDVIKYLDQEGTPSGTITVLGQGSKTGTCGTTKTGPCAFFWNVTDRNTDIRLKPHLLLTRMFGDNNYSGMKQLDASTFVITTERKGESCQDTTSYTVKILGTSGWVILKDVETNCTTDGKVLKYSTTTIDSAF